jgi:hypothetical protein
MFSLYYNMSTMCFVMLNYAPVDTRSNDVYINIAVDE